MNTSVTCTEVWSQWVRQSVEVENKEHIIPPEVPAALLLPWRPALHFIVISRAASEWQLSCEFSLQAARFEVFLNLSFGIRLKTEDRGTLFKLHFIVT